MTKVVAALIRENNKFLICQRPADKARGLLWEFVGGKVESGETDSEALVRECSEELNIEVKVGKEFASVTHEYADMTVDLTLYECRITGGTPTLLEHNDMRWITPSEIPDYLFCPADIVFLDKIKEIGKNG